MIPIRLETHVFSKNPQKKNLFFNALGEYLSHAKPWQRPQGLPDVHRRADTPLAKET
jgi:hypothetical protein